MVWTIVKDETQQDENSSESTTIQVTANSRRWICNPDVCLARCRECQGRQQQAGVKKYCLHQLACTCSQYSESGSCLHQHLVNMRDSVLPLDPLDTMNLPEMVKAKLSLLLSQLESGDMSESQLQELTKALSLDDHDNYQKKTASSVLGKKAFLIQSSF